MNMRQLPTGDLVLYCIYTEACQPFLNVIFSRNASTPQREKKTFGSEWNNGNIRNNLKSVSSHDDLNVWTCDTTSLNNVFYFYSKIIKFFLLLCRADDVFYQIEWACFGGVVLFARLILPQLILVYHMPALRSPEKLKKPKRRLWVTKMVHL